MQTRCSLTTPRMDSTVLPPMFQSSTHSNCSCLDFSQASSTTWLLWLLAITSPQSCNWLDSLVTPVPTLQLNRALATAQLEPRRSRPRSRLQATLLRTSSSCKSFWTNGASCSHPREPSKLPCHMLTLWFWKVASRSPSPWLPYSWWTQPPTQMHESLYIDWQIKLWNKFKHFHQTNVSRFK